MAGVPGLIDFHTHFFSGSVLERASAGSLEPMSLMSGDAAAPTSRAIEEQRARWCEELSDHGLPLAASLADHEDELEPLLAAAGSSDGRLVPFGPLDPTAPGAAERAEELLTRRGLRGLVLTPSLHGYRIDAPEVEPVLALAERLGAPLIVHCGLLPPRLADERLGERFDPALSSPLHLIPAALRHERLAFVVPRFGGGFLRETLMAGEVAGNVLVDSSSDHGWLRTQSTSLGLEDIFERALGVFGPERVLFGTGSTLVPRGWRFDLFHLQREALGALDVSSGDQALIFHENARRVLGL